MNRPSNFIRYMILNEFCKGSIESQAVENICSVYGENILKEDECKFWYGRFRSGDQSLDNETETGKDEKKGELENTNRSTAKHKIPVEDSTDDDNETKKRKRTAIKIADDVMRTIVGWITFKKLPDMTLINRQFWRRCDGEMDTRKYCINFLRVVSLRLQYIGSCGLQIKGEKKPVELVRAGTNYPREWQIVPFAEVEPPLKFTIGKLYLEAKVNGKFNETTIQFLRASKPLFENICLQIKLKKPHKHAGCLDDDLLACLDNCFVMDISFVDDHIDFFIDLFEKPAILNYNRIDVTMICEVLPHFSPIDTIFEWLHTQPTVNPKAQRQISFRMHHTHHGNISWARLIKRFLEDDTPHTYLIRLVGVGPERLVKVGLKNNLSTGEILFTRKIHERPRDRDVSGIELIRCPKETKEFTKFEQQTDNQRNGNRVEIH